MPLALIEVSFKQSSSSPQVSGRACCARAAQQACNEGKMSAMTDAVRGPGASACVGLPACWAVTATALDASPATARARTCCCSAVHHVCMALRRNASHSRIRALNHRACPPSCCRFSRRRQLHAFQFRCCHDCCRSGDFCLQLLLPDLPLVLFLAVRSACCWLPGICRQAHQSSIPDTNTPAQVQPPAAVRQLLQNAGKAG